MTELKELEKPDRQLTRREINKIKDLLLSPAQEKAVREVWAKEEEPPGATKFNIIAYLLMLSSVSMLTANVLYNNSITVFADNVIVAGVIVTTLALIAAVWDMNKTLEAEDKNIPLGHTGISLIQKGKFLSVWFWRVIILSFLLLYIGNGHLLTGLLLIIVILITIGTMKNLKNRVKEILRNIDQAVAE